jgi:ribosome-associated protein
MNDRTTKAVTKRGLPAEIKTAVKAAAAKKAEDILVLDLREASTFTEYFVIMHGHSSRQNAAISGAVEAVLKAAGVRPLGVEGESHGEWILIDYGWFIVHVFSPTARAFYALEKLWADAPTVSF